MDLELLKVYEINKNIICGSNFDGGGEYPWLLNIGEDQLNKFKLLSIFLGNASDWLRIRILSECFQ